MTGYQEILTDPSYDGQIVCMTYPEIGNVGVNPEDVESFKPFVQGFVVKEYWDMPSNWRARKTLDEYMARARHRRHSGDRHAGAGAPHPRHRRAAGRARDRGASTQRALVEEAKARPSLEGQDLATRVSTPRALPLARGARGSSKPDTATRGAQTGPLVAAFDFGIKLNILRNLAALGLPGRGRAGEHARPKTFARSNPTASSSPTAPVIPMRCRGAIPVVAELDRQATRSSASASAIRFSGSRSGARPTS